MRSLIPAAFGLVLLFAAMLAAPAAAQLPADDSARYHLVTVTQPRPTTAGAAMLQAIDTHPELAQIAGKCKRFAFDTANPIYRTRYAGTLPEHEAPIVALVRSDGGVIYKASGGNVPGGDGLAAALKAAAIADQQANPPAANAYAAGYSADCPDCPNRRPVLPQLDGSRLPSINPIPDSVTVETQFTLPDSAAYVAGGLGLLVLIGCGVLAAFALLAGLVMILK